MLEGVYSAVLSSNVVAAATSRDPVLSQAVQNHGAPLIISWGCVVGPSRPIGRPSVDQSEYFSGHKRTHVVKYQAVMGADGTACELDGLYLGRSCDAGIVGESGLYSKLERLTRGCLQCNYGDPAYSLRPYGGATLTEQQRLFNEGICAIWRAIE
ncbi:hypothetical protein MRX96_006983 [Rhipicephalus microplus]